jgi:hypothetical protein
VGGETGTMDAAEVSATDAVRDKKDDTILS